MLHGAITVIAFSFGKYAIDIDGIGLELVYGMQTGNSGRAVTTDYNDLDETAYSVLVTYGNFAADYRRMMQETQQTKE